MWWLLLLWLLLMVERPHTWQSHGAIHGSRTRSVRVMWLGDLGRIGILGACVHARRRLVGGRVGVRGLSLPRMAGLRKLRTGHWRRKGQRRVAAVARPVLTAVTAIKFCNRDLRGVR